MELRTTTPGALMEEEIAQQPEALANLLALGADDVSRAASAVREREPASVLVVARGSSDHAALYLKYLLEIRLGLPVGLCSPSSVTLFGAHPFSPSSVVVGISQSGGSPDLVATLRAAGEQGALTLAMTNAPASPLATAADLHIDLRAGTERSVAATKTYTNELLACYLLVESIVGANGGAAAVPAAAEAVLGARPQVAEVARELVGATRLVTTARGYGQATAREGALKLMETCYLPTLAFSAADLLHGPFAMLGEGVPAIALLDGGPAAEGMGDIVARLVDTGAPTFTFGPGATSNVAGTAGHVQVSHELPADLAPIVDVVPLQMLALELSRLRGLDADTPRSLRKVTSTL